MWNIGEYFWKHKDENWHVSMIIYIKEFQIKMTTTMVSILSIYRIFDF